MADWTNPANSQQLSTLLPKDTSSGFNQIPQNMNLLVPGQSSAERLMGTGALLTGMGSQTIPTGVSLLGQPLDYWQKQLQDPTRTRLLEQMAPAAASVVGQYSTGKKALSQQPRGGGTSALAAELPFQEAGAITGLLEQQLQQYLNVLQPQAAQQITGIGQELSNLGLSEMQLGSQDISSQMQNETARRAQTLQTISQLISAALGGGGMRSQVR